MLNDLTFYEINNFVVI